MTRFSCSVALITVFLSVLHLLLERVEHKWPCSCVFCGGTQNNSDRTAVYSDVFAICQFYKKKAGFTSAYAHTNVASCKWRQMSNGRYCRSTSCASSYDAQIGLSCVLLSIVNLSNNINRQTLYLMDPNCPTFNSETCLTIHNWKLFFNLKISFLNCLSTSSV